MIVSKKKYRKIKAILKDATRLFDRADELHNQWYGREGEMTPEVKKEIATLVKEHTRLGIALLVAKEELEIDGELVVKYGGRLYIIGDDNIFKMKEDEIEDLGG